jgi:alkylation response protein AidB-like acyl-CoA dehydrogenase
LLDLFKPKRYGGLEASLRAASEVQIELGRGCGSTAWVVSQINGSSLMACLFPARTREEIFARPDACLAASMTLCTLPSVKRVPGGYVLSGAWAFCTGCRHASSILVCAPLDSGDERKANGETGASSPGLFALPASRVEIRDDWRVSGLSGTGSNSVVAERVFVPEHHVMDLAPAFQENFVPEGLDGPLYRMPLFAGQLLNAASSALGMAQAALDEFKARLPRRGIAYTFYEKRAECAVTHLQIAEATVKLDAARLLVRRGVEEVERHAMSGEILSQDGRIKVRMDAAYAVNLCRESIDILFDASGGGSLLLSSPIQRMARDARALSLHGAFSLPTILETYGRSLLGLPTNATFI